MNEKAFKILVCKQTEWVKDLLHHEFFMSLRCSNLLNEKHITKVKYMLIMKKNVDTKLF